MFSPEHELNERLKRLREREDALLKELAAVRAERADLLNPCAWKLHDANET